MGPSAHGIALEVQPRRVATADSFTHAVKGPRPGETVHIIWWAEDDTATLTIDFKKDSPCESKTFKSNTNFVKAKVRQDADPEAYGYDVVYSVGGKTYTDDPQILIN